MPRTLLWLRYAFCTGLGLGLIGLAAISGWSDVHAGVSAAAPEPPPDVSG